MDGDDDEWEPTWDWLLSKWHRDNGRQAWPGLEGLILTSAEIRAGQEDRGEGMTPDEMTQVVEAVDQVMGRRMEEVYGTIEELRQQVAEAVQGLNATAQVLHDNDTAIMGRIMQQDGSVAAEFTQEAADAWRRFVTNEAKQLGIKIVVPK